MNPINAKLSTTQRYLNAVAAAIHGQYRAIGALKESKRCLIDSENEESKGFYEAEAKKWLDQAKEHFLYRDENLIMARKLKNKIINKEY